MTTRAPSTLLDALIAERRWTTDETVRRFIEAARRLDEPATLSAAQLKRWRRAQLTTLPRPTACRVAQALFGHPIEALLAPVARASENPVSSSWAAFSPVVHESAPSPSSARASAQIPFLSSDVENDPLMGAAHEASEHAADAGRTIDDTTLEQLHAEVVRLAHAFPATPPAVMFAQLKRTRDLSYRMLERTRRPAQSTDLYLICGQLSGLLAGASFDLGQPDAATEQARAALTYGRVIDHHVLCAWARATLSMIAFWSGRPREGTQHAASGLHLVDVGDVAVRLHAVQARSWALLGARNEALAALHAGEEARRGDPGSDDLAGDVGGEFTFGHAREALSSGATLLALGDGAGAARQALAAVNLYEEMPVSERWTGGMHSARIDLATAHLMALDLEAVGVCLAPTLVLTPEHRTERVTVRMRALRHQVGGPAFQRSSTIRALGDDLEEFLGGSSSGRGLPGPA